MANSDKKGKTILIAETAEKEKLTKERIIAGELAGIEQEMTLIRLSQLSIDYKVNKIKILLGLNE